MPDIQRSAVLDDGGRSMIVHLPSRTVTRRKPVKRRRAQSAGSEHDEAAMFWRMVMFYENDYPELRMLFAVPNGGARSKAAGGKLKAEGVRPGVSDYIALVPRNGFHGLVLELKTAKGVVSKEQSAFIAAARIAGYRAEVARGWSEAWDVVSSYVGINDNPEPEKAA